jgi:hypothetical protein
MFKIIAAVVVGLLFAPIASADIVLNRLNPHHEGIWIQKEGGEGVFYQITPFSHDGDFYRAVVTRVSSDSDVTVTLTNSWGIWSATALDNNVLKPDDRKFFVYFESVGCDNLTYFRSDRSFPHTERLELQRLTPRSRPCEDLWFGD